MLQYQKLEGRKAIRLLHIRPGLASEPIRCELVHSSLLENPAYDALSYCWGPKENPGVIICNNIEIPVTRNLHSALARFRHPDLPRIMWIDAVCINQDDNDEKSEQVALMADIYMRAQRGLIWLGEEQEGDKTAFALLRKLDIFLRWYESEFPTSLNAHGQALPFHIQAVQAKLRDMMISPSEWSSLIRFFRRSWFGRVWVIQEAALTANNPVPTNFACGDVDIPWGQLANVARGIVSLDLFFLYGLGSARGLGHMAICLMDRLRRSHRNSPSRTLLEMLDSTRESCATDPRDKIFSLHGLLGQSEAEEPLLRPDYNKTCAQVYTDTAIYLLSKHGSLDLLQRVPWTLPQNGGFRGALDIPSWVPDWSVRHVVPLLPSKSYSAGGDTRPEFRILADEKVLAIRGRILDRLNRHHPEPPGGYVGRR